MIYLWLTEVTALWGRFPSSVVPHQPWELAKFHRGDRREKTPSLPWFGFSHIWILWLAKKSWALKYWTLSSFAASLQSCPTLCNPIDSSPPGSPFPGILQARTLEWVAISFSNAWKWKWSRSGVSDPQRPHGLQPTRLLYPWNFTGKSTGVGCHCLLWNTGQFCWKFSGRGVR